jgi:hypothetical protein
VVPARRDRAPAPITTSAPNSPDGTCAVREATRLTAGSVIHITGGLKILRQAETSMAKAPSATIIGNAEESMSHPMEAGVSRLGKPAIERLGDAELNMASGGNKAAPPPNPPIYLHFSFKLVAVKTIS